MIWLRSVFFKVLNFTKMMVRFNIIAQKILVILLIVWWLFKILINDLVADSILCFDKFFTFYKRFFQIQHRCWHSFGLLIKRLVRFNIVACRVLGFLSQNLVSINIFVRNVLDFLMLRLLSPVPRWCGSLCIFQKNHGEFNTDIP